MTTVLNNRTTKDMEKFLGSNGTQSKFFHANEKATEMWIEMLKSGSENCDDIVPLMELVPWMITRLPKDRPTSHQVVNCILNFETRCAFYGVCCGNAEVTVQSAHDENLPSYAKGIFDESSEHASATSDCDSTVLAHTSRTSSDESGDASLGQSRLEESSNEPVNQMNNHVPAESDRRTASASWSLQNPASSTIPATENIHLSVYDFLRLKSR